MNEVDCDGNVIHLTSFDVPEEVAIGFQIECPSSVLAVSFFFPIFWCSGLLAGCGSGGGGGTEPR